MSEDLGDYCACCGNGVPRGAYFCEQCDDLPIGTDEATRRERAAAIHALLDAPEGATPSTTQG